jgi:hypothetical protein
MKHPFELAARAWIGCAAVASFSEQHRMRPRPLADARTFHSLLPPFRFLSLVLFLVRCVRSPFRCPCRFVCRWRFLRRRPAALARPVPKEEPPNNRWGCINIDTGDIMMATSYTPAYGL